jgi:muramoyltetrapeptide carboxypeptidase
MNRKSFINSLVPLVLPAAGLAGSNKAHTFFSDTEAAIIPPYLRKGDTIGITSPGGFITADEIQPALKRIKDWGFEVSIGTTIGKRDNTFGGTDDERAADLQRMLDDKNIRAIMCARGGYGSIRIVDKLNFKKFTSHPKWFIGFSDITVMHSHINRHFGVATIHSKMCNSFPSVWEMAEPIQVETIESIRQCLSGEKMQYNAPVNMNNRTGTATGILVGGNLKTLETLAGTASDLYTKNKILFLEDTGEYLYSIDRMFWNLKRNQKLSGLKGLIIGGFKPKKDDAGEEFGLTLEEIVLEKVKDYDFPVCFDFPVGHQKNNFALKCGIIHKLVVTREAVKLNDNG